MSTHITKEQITERLHALGADWHITDAKTVNPEDGWDAKPMYHVHPNREHPYQGDILTFSSLAKIAAYCAAREQAQADREQEQQARQDDLMQCPKCGSDDLDINDDDQWFCLSCGAVIGPA